MNRLLLSAGLTAATILLSGAANAQTDTDANHERQMEAYRTYVSSQGTKPTETGQAAIAAGNNNTPPVSVPAATSSETTVEKTTKTNYDVSKRKVGLVGGRPFQPKTEKVEGGETKEVTVNGVETENEVVKPDPMEGKTLGTDEAGDYYTGKRGVQAYKPEEKKPNSNLDVHYTGHFNN